MSKHAPYWLLAAMAAAAAGCAAETFPSTPTKAPPEFNTKAAAASPRSFSQTGFGGNPQSGGLLFANALSAVMPGQFTSNGRSCATCHASAGGFALSASDAKARPDTDPLIRALMADAGPGDEALGPIMRDQLREVGLIRVVMPNPTHRAGGPRDNPPFIRVFRAVPTVFNAALGALETRQDFQGRTLTSFTMWDGREGSLEHQAGSASIGHAQVRLVGDPAASPETVRLALDDRISEDIAAYERLRLSTPLQILGAQLKVPVAAPRFAGTIFEGAPEIPDDDKVLKREFFRTVELKTPAQFRGMRVFAGTRDRPACTVCHNMPEILTGGTRFFADARTSRENTQPRLAPPADRAAMIAAGFQFVREEGGAGEVQQLPLSSLYLQDASGRLVRVSTPDPGLAGRTGLLKDLHQFKISQLRGISRMERFYHDNHERDLDGIVHHYEDQFPELFQFTPTQRADLRAFLEAL